MIIGIDMGGTHCDGVLIQDNKILKEEKKLTKPDQIKESILELLKSLIQNTEASKIQKVHLSTTLITNALSQKKVNKTAVLLIPGPGASTKELLKDKLHFVCKKGYIDHRGVQISALSEDELEEAFKYFSEKKTDTVAIISKFSIRNPILENQAEDFFKKKGFQVFKGSSFSGKLNFPRRVLTAYLTASVSKLYKNAITKIEEGIRSLNIKAPIFILKADGGAVTLADSLKYPIESVLSGPAASIMGALVSKKEFENEDAIVLDIGGTTTDLGFFINGVALLEPLGIEIEGLKSLVRALKVFPIALGGDSLFSIENNTISLDNKREGVAYLFGGKKATLTDIFAAYYEKNPKSIEGLKKILDEKNFDEQLKALVKYTALFILNRIKESIKEINSKPIYTVNDFFQRKDFKPSKLILVGGAAPFFEKALAQFSEFKTVIPKHFGICNAIGAALSRVTTELNLFANTADGKLSIPELDHYESITRSFNLAKAEEKALTELKSLAAQKGIEDISKIEVTEANSFNMVRGFSTDGKNIRLKVQIKPGLSEQLS